MSTANLSKIKEDEDNELNRDEYRRNGSDLRGFRRAWSKLKVVMNFKGTAILVSIAFVMIALERVGYWAMHGVDYFSYATLSDVISQGAPDVVTLVAPYWLIAVCILAVLITVETFRLRDFSNKSVGFFRELGRFVVGILPTASIGGVWGITYHHCLLFYRHQEKLSNQEVFVYLGWVSVLLTVGFAGYDLINHFFLGRRSGPIYYLLAAVVLCVPFALASGIARADRVEHGLNQPIRWVVFADRRLNNAVVGKSYVGKVGSYLVFRADQETLMIDASAHHQIRSSGK